MDDPDITRLIKKWLSGDVSAENQLFDALYRKLHRIALQCLRSERRAESLSPTLLVHEAYLRVTGTEQISVKDRGHFVSLMARVMRHYIVDRAKEKDAQIHGGGLQRVDLKDEIVGTKRDADRILAVDRAMEKLEKEKPRLARVVELLFFTGLNQEEAAEVLGLSSRQVRRDWDEARLRLFGDLNGGF